MIRTPPQGALSHSPPCWGVGFTDPSCQPGPSSRSAALILPCLLPRIWRDRPQQGEDAKVCPAPSGNKDTSTTRTRGGQPPAPWVRDRPFAKEQSGHLRRWGGDLL